MNAPKSRANSAKADEAPASIPQTTPTSIGYGHPEFHFIQVAMELQKSVTRVEAVLEDVKKTNENMGAKVSRLEKIAYAAGIVLLIFLTVAGWMLNTAKDFALDYFKESLGQHTVVQKAQPQGDQQSSKSP
jgi:hypothetical protein